MKMTPAFMIISALLVFWVSVYVAVFLPALTYEDHPSDTWMDMTAEQAQGHQLYNDNGCSYCHTSFVRVIDRDAERIARSGDYYEIQPAILGTERTGPDLSQEGGEHPDDWHMAHFFNPRYTRPMSLMPSWEFLGDKDVARLTAYVQYLGGKEALPRIERQDRWRPQAQQAHAAGVAVNIPWLHDHVPGVWRKMPNPYPATPAALERGKKVYQEYCINCHGPIGDGNGMAANYTNPPPLNFTELRGYLEDGKYIGGIFYYQIMNGITGTAMPYFKRELESEKIWDVSNYVAVTFLGYADATIEPRGIQASYEPPWTNPYHRPTTSWAATAPAKAPATQADATTPGGAQ